MIGSKKETIQLWGREFDLVKQGLSQDQVTTFVTELVNQNNALKKKTESLTFMETLAEKTVDEADKLATSIANKAREEATNILQAAEEEAARIKINAEKEAKQLLIESEEKLKNTMKTKLAELYQKILSHLGETIAEGWPEEPVPGKNETSDQQQGMVQKCEEIEQSAEGGNITEGRPEEPVSGKNETPDQQEDMVPQNEDIEKSAGGETKPIYYNGKVDLEILPPLDVAQLMKFRKELLNVPHLRITQITSSLKYGCKISGLLDKPIPLLGVLKTMLDVRDAVADAESQQSEDSRRILVTLAPGGQA